MVFGRKLSGYLFRFRWLLAGAGIAGILALAIWLRQSSLSSGFSSGFVLYSYLQIVGTLLSFTYAANALVRFRGMHGRLPILVAAIAVGRRKTGEQIVVGLWHDDARGLLEIVPGVRHLPRNAGCACGRAWS